MPLYHICYVTLDYTPITVATGNFYKNKEDAISDAEKFIIKYFPTMSRIGLETWWQGFSYVYICEIDENFRIIESSGKGGHEQCKLECNNLSIVENTEEKPSCENPQ